MLTITTTYSSFSVLDLHTTRAFYGDVLGLQSHERDGMLVVHLHAGGEAVLYPKGTAHQPATFTMLNFVVPDVPAAVAELTGRGVAFERYDGTPMQTDADGVYRGVGPLFRVVQRPLGERPRRVRSRVRRDRGRTASRA
jgi:catechol 2,3-dioxygenase-like lactoylglutathione lyase family enzyme